MSNLKKLVGRTSTVQNRTKPYKSNYNKFIKLISLFLAILFMGVSCTKDELYDTKPNTTPEAIPKSLNNYQVEGQQFVEAMSYIKSYETQIYDSNAFCPIEFKKSGVKDYNTQSKLENRIIYFYDSLGYKVDKILLEQVIGSIDTLSVQDLLNYGVTNEEVQIMDRYKNYYSSHKNLNQLIGEVNQQISEVKNNAKLSLIAKDRLLTSFHIYLASYQYGIDQGLTTTNELENIDICGMPCGVATALYAAAFIGLCAATGPVGLACGAIGFGGSVWGLYDAC